MPPRWRNPFRRLFTNYPLWPVLVCLGILWFGLIGTYGFLGSEEPRYARIPQEMADRGDWVVPVLKGYPWMEKPPLLYWGIMASNALFGRTEFAARFPSALLALLFTAFLHGAVRDVFGRRAAFFAALSLGTTLLYSAFAMAAVMDIHLTVFLGAGLLLFWRSWLGFEGKAPVRHPNIHLWGACFAFGVAALAKGLVSLAVPVLAIVPFLVMAGGWRHYLHWRILPGILLFLAAAVPWHLLMIRRQGFHFVLVYFINHHLARFFTSIHHHSKPFWFYLPVLLMGLFPWTPFLFKMRGLRDALRRAGEDARASGTAFALCWAFFPFLFFSVSEAKLAGYILPLFPALALFLALGTERFIDDEQPDRTLAAFVLGTPVVVALAMPVFVKVRFDRLLEGIGFGLLFLAAALPFLGLYRRGKRAAAAASVSLMLFIPALVGIPAFFETFEPDFNRRHVCEAVKRLTGPDNPLVVFQHLHHSIDYYTGYTCSENILEPPLLADLLVRRPSPVYVLTLMENYSHILLPPGFRMKPLFRIGTSLVVKVTRLEVPAP
ncbi:MAG: glycosyltransferase family 39 protein [Acidobacteria bacterium]|nr:glycosyltransferase family 39 protein [Acidobacteriota bacterium]